MSSTGSSDFSEPMPYPLSTDGPYARCLYYRFRLFEEYVSESYAAMLAYGELEERLRARGEQIWVMRVHVWLQQLERQHDVLQAIMDEHEEAYMRASRHDCICL